MNARPILHGMVNSTDKCRCGEEKSIYRQWCDKCWDKVPLKVAKNYALRSHALSRQIETCDKCIKEATINENKSQPV